MKTLHLPLVVVLVLGTLLTANCHPAAAQEATQTGEQTAAARGPLRVHPDNPRYFTDGTELPDGSLRAVFLTGSHTWNNLVDIGRSDPPEAFDFEAYLDFLKRYGHNFIRLWAWDSTIYDTRANGALGKDYAHFAAPHPWLRVGPDMALDGKPKFDLTKLNPEYFERLRKRVEAARDRGIYVSIMLFEGWGLSHGNQGRRTVEEGWAWRNHPFNPANNINGVEIQGATETRGRVHRMGNRLANEFQAAYIRHVVDAVNDLDNVLYEVINEGGEKEWDWWVVETVHEYEKTRPKQHPIGITGHGAERLDSMLASPADWISPGGRDGFRENPPRWNGEKVSLLDTDHIWGVGGSADWVWKSFLRGHNVLFMDPYDGAVLGKPNDPRWEPVRVAMGHALRLANHVGLAKMTPQDERSSTGYCLANAGSEYLVYQPKEGSFMVDLADGTYSVDWFEPAEGKTVAGEEVKGGAQREFNAPFSGPAIVHLKTK